MWKGNNSESNLSNFNLLHIECKYFSVSEFICKGIQIMRSIGSFADECDKQFLLVITCAQFYYIFSVLCQKSMELFTFWMWYALIVI